MRARRPRRGRRIGAATSETRSRLLDVTEQIMLEEGYAAVSSRSVAARAGVKAPLVHYYFPRLDDLFVAVHLRRSERNFERLAEQLRQTDQPLRVLWEYSSDRTGTALTQEFLALANHRKAIQMHIAEIAERLRKLQLGAISGVLERYGVDTDAFPPVALLVLMASIPRVIVIEEALGLRMGHAETVALVERYLEKLEGTRRKSRKPAAARPRARHR
jgi:AcrR family transcriptional regulator